MSAYETIPRTDCGKQTIAASPATADPEFARWWETPDARTGHAPSACLDLGSAQKAWAAARALPPAPAPEPDCPMRAFLDKLESADPAVRAAAEAHAEHVAAELSRSIPQHQPAPVAKPVTVAGGRFEQVGTVTYERVNDEYHAILNDELVSDGQVLYRFVSDSAAGAAPAGEESFADSLNADEIARLRAALVWMGESTYESHEECEIYRLRLVRRLISAVIGQRDQFYAQREVEQAAGGPLKDHEIRDAVNQLRDVARQYHNTQQLRSRIQEVVLPLFTRGRQA